MQSVFHYLDSVLFVYWQNSEYQILLFISIVVVLLLEKKEIEKKTYAWYTIICFLGLMNPITVYITNKVWGQSVAYYCRQFSLMPIFLIIAYGVVLLTNKMRGKSQIVLVCLVAILICVSGKQIYHESWYSKAENYSKVPNDIIEISRYLQNTEKRMKVAAPTEISSYLRQYMNVLQIQGRQVSRNDMEELLLSDNPNVALVMQKAGDDGCDYVIAKYSENAERVYMNCGYEPCFKTLNYMIYNVNGIVRWKYLYDDKNRLEKKTLLDENDCVKCTSEGYASVEYEYDLYGEIVLRRYYNEYGKPASISSGQWAEAYEYDKDERIKKITYLNENDAPQIINVGYAQIQYEYDDGGNKSIEYYFDEKNMPVALAAGQYAAKYEYNELKKIIQTTYLDENGNPKITSYGYASVRYDYDEKGNKCEEHYYGTDGEPIAADTGEFAVKFDYDADSRVIMVTYLDQNDNEMEMDYGYSTIRYQYDEEGNEIGKEYYNLEGEKIN